MYFRVRPQIPIFKDVQPLLEIDRDERKFDVFLTFHRSSLLVSDMKVFLPFTINLDPYIKKKIKEEQQSVDEEASHNSMFKWNNSMSMSGGPSTMETSWPMNRTAVANRHSRLQRPNVPPQIPPGSTSMPLHVTPWPSVRPGYEWQLPQWAHIPPAMEPIPKPLSAVTTLPVRINTISP